MHFHACHYVTGDLPESCEALFPYPSFSSARDMLLEDMDEAAWHAARRGDEEKEADLRFLISQLGEVPGGQEKWLGCTGTHSWSRETIPVTWQVTSCTNPGHEDDVPD